MERALAIDSEVTFEQWLDGFIKSARLNRWFGSLEVKFEEGRIVHIKKTDSIKL